MFCRWGWSSWLPSSPKTCCPIGTTRYDTFWIMWTMIYTILIRPGMIHYWLYELIYWYNQMIGHKLGRTFQVSISNFLLVFEIFCSLHWYHLRPHTESLSLFLSLSLSSFLRREAQKARVWYSSTPTFLSSANLIRDITQFST